MDFAFTGYVYPRVPNPDLLDEHFSNPSFTFSFPLLKYPFFFVEESPPVTFKVSSL